MRTLLAGDTHGCMEWWWYLIEQAQEFEADCILQLGDFGYWEHTPEGVAYLDVLSDSLWNADLDGYFIDGNHENHPLLWDRYCQEPGFAKVRDNLFYIPRGHSWEWDGERWLALGGGYSVDVGERRYRMARGEEEQWWPTELITDEQVEAACAQERADIIVSHDAPGGVDIAGLYMRSNRRYSRIATSEQNRGRLRRVVEWHEPDRLYHGHYHLAHRSDLRLDCGKMVKVEGLSQEYTGRGSFTVHDSTPLP